jgi:hypothetical protein
MKQILFLAFCLLLTQASFADDRGIGACCIIDHCVDMPQNKCTAMGGTYMGDGTSCADNPCGGSGACCLGDNEDCTIVSEDECIALGGEYAGDGATCDGDLCISGACCFGTDCQDGISGNQCTFSGGDSFHAGVTCDSNPCGGGACCLGDSEDCTIMSEDECIALGGEYAGEGAGCEDNICGMGACCWFSNSNPECSEMNFLQCRQMQDYTWFGYGTWCTGSDAVVCPKRGGCCIEDTDECVVLLEDTCVAAGGDYAGDDTTCDDGDICERGACCYGTDCIDGIIGIQCVNSGGQFHSGKTCDPIGDVDGNGSVGVADLLAIINDWACQESCGSTDVNNDGNVDVTDLLIVVGNWGNENPCG